ncbi:MAG TPA: hypothetical protein VFQ53_05640 [Kofleriaceae bacterium]|nr:hypothetical protein [Kofleriaceae bacterium]
MMRNLVGVVLLIAACGGKQKPPPSNATDDGVVKDTRTEIERRRDAACEKVGTKLTECAVADAKAELDAGRMTKKDFDANTAAGVRERNTAEFVKACKVPMSSRQVRVLEVCYREETECSPLADCLTHLNDGAGKPATK